MKAGLVALRFLALGLLAAVAASCSTQYIRSSALSQLQRGEFEVAISTTQEGLRDHPGSAELEATMLRVREESISRLLAGASELRSRGNLDGAAHLVDRARAIAANDERVLRALHRLELDRKEAEILPKARELLAREGAREALDLLRPLALEDPQTPALRSLVRQAEARYYQQVSAGVRLPATAPVTLELRDAPAKQVFEAISRETKVNFVLDRDIRPELRISVYVRQASLDKALDLVLSANQLASKVLDERTIVVFPNTPDKIREYQDLIVRSIFLAHTEARQAATALKSILKMREPYVDEKMNLLVLRDGPEQIAAAERLLTILDQGEPEVMVDIAVLEVSSQRLLDLGIQFPDTFSLTPLPPSGASGLTLANLRGMGKDQIGLGIAGVTGNLQSTAGEATVLANPRIRAKNREKAHILIGDKYPVVSSAAAPNAGYVSENITYIDVGIKVDFEPVVGLDGDVTIKLNLEVSSIANQVKTASGSIAYQIGTRSAGTTLRLQDGETQILGGLISRNDSTTSNRLPGLGDIPLLGRLFSSQTDSSDRSEVLLSITPHILSNFERPDPTLAAFYSGTEGVPRLPTAPAPAAPAKPAASAEGPSAAPGGARLALAQAAGKDSPAPAAPFEAPGTIPAAVADGVSVLLNAPKAVTNGDAFELVLTANIAPPLRAFPISLSYDPTRLRFESFVVDEILSDPKLTTVAQSIDSAGGRISLAIVRNSDVGLSGAAPLGKLKFSALQAGATQVRILSATPIGTLGPVKAPGIPEASTIEVR